MAHQGSHIPWPISGGRSPWLPGKKGQFFSLPALAQKYPAIGRLPVSIRIVLESVLRNCDGRKVTPEHVRQLAQLGTQAERKDEIPFVVSRVVLQDFTGVPLLADRLPCAVPPSAWAEPKKIEPLVPVDLVVDHSIMVDHYGKKNSLDLNMKLEFQRNRERYEFMKWGMQAFDTFGVVPRALASCTRSASNTWRAACTRPRMAPTTPTPWWHRQPHHHDQRHWRGGLGVGGIEAEAAMLEPAGVLPHA